jgi:hypothetical protein
MTVLILLAVICGETFWLYRLGAFGGVVGAAAVAAAAVTVFYDKAAAIVGGWLS